MPSSGGDQAVEHVRVLDLVASAKRLDDALNMAAALADVLDEVEIFVVADLLDANEHGCCPSLQSDTMPNPMRSSSKASLLASEDPVLHHSSGQARETRDIPRVTRPNKGQSVEVGSDPSNKILDRLDALGQPGPDLSTKQW